MKAKKAQLAFEIEGKLEACFENLCLDNQPERQLVAEGIADLIRSLYKLRRRSERTKKKNRSILRTANHRNEKAPSG